MSIWSITSNPGILKAGHSSVALMMQFILKALTFSSDSAITPHIYRLSFTDDMALNIPTIQQTGTRSYNGWNNKQNIGLWK